MQTIDISTLTPIGPLDYHMSPSANGRYLYRGVALIASDGGLDVVDPEHPDMEIGWGATMFDAMDVANVHVDGFERTKTR